MSERVTRRDFLTVAAVAAGAALGLKNKKEIEQTAWEAESRDGAIVEGTVESLKQVDQNSLSRDLDLATWLEKTRKDAGLKPLGIPKRPDGFKGNG